MTITTVWSVDDFRPGVSFIKLSVDFILKVYIGKFSDL